MMSEPSVDNELVPYQQRVVAFIDILGFRELVSLSVMHPEATHHIYSLLKGIQSREIMEAVYGSIPTFGLDGTQTFKSARSLPEKERVYAHLKSAWPIEITQFSDSLVLSCSAESTQTVILLLEFIGRLTIECFQLGFLLRGGIANGLMIHEEGGPVFGPGFVQAYAMESNQAGWARIIVEKCIVDLVVRAEHEMQKPKPIGLLFSNSKDVEHTSQLTLASAYRYLPKVTKLEHIDPVAIHSKLAALVQTYATDEKLAKRYLSLLDDWESLVGKQASGD